MPWSDVDLKIPILTNLSRYIFESEILLNLIRPLKFFILAYIFLPKMYRSNLISESTGATVS
jgi:hypothetical protein